MSASGGVEGARGRRGHEERPGGERGGRPTQEASPTVSTSPATGDEVWRGPGGERGAWRRRSTRCPSRRAGRFRRDRRRDSSVERACVEEDAAPHEDGFAPPPRASLGAHRELSGGPVAFADRLEAEGGVAEGAVPIGQARSRSASDVMLRRDRWRRAARARRGSRAPRDRGRGVRVVAGGRARRSSCTTASISARARASRSSMRARAVSQARVQLGARRLFEPRREEVRRGQGEEEEGQER